MTFQEPTPEELLEAMQVADEAEREVLSMKLEDVLDSAFKEVRGSVDRLAILSVLKKAADPVLDNLPNMDLTTIPVEDHIKPFVTALMQISANVAKEAEEMEKNFDEHLEEYRQDVNTIKQTLRK